MYKKKMFVITLSVILVFALASLAGAEKMAKKQELIYNSLGEPDTLDPALSTGVPEATLEGLLLEGLVRLDAHMAPVPGIAESWDTNDDLTEFIFHIRDGAVWSDGKPVTAHDFEYSMKRVLQPELAAEYAYMLYYVKNGEKYNADPDSGITADDVGVKALDDKTLKITLEAPCPYFLQMIAHNSYLPARRDMVEANPDGWATNPKTYIGNGPFKMVEWEHNSKITFVKNDKYWDADSVKLDTITVTLVDNIDTAVSVFSTGELDLIESPTTQSLPQLKKEGKYFVQPGMIVYYYTINGTKEGLDNPLVRKALAMGINRQIVVDEILQGGQIPAMALVPNGMADANPEKDFREVGGNYFNDYDVATAKALLAEAGYPNGKGLPEFEILYNTGAAHENIALAVQSWWNQLGIKTKLVGQEWGVYLNTRTQLDYDIARAGWGADYLDPMTFLDLFQTGVGLNDTGYSNPTYDTLISIAKMTDNQNVRMRALHEAERILIEEDMVIIPFYFYTNSWAAQPYVRDVIHNPFGTKDFKYAWIAE